MNDYEAWVAGSPIKENSDHIKIEGHRGRWYVIDTIYVKGSPLFLLEHETYGDEAPSLIVKEDGTIVLDDVWNGFDDYFEQVYTGSHYVGEIVTHNGHECRVTKVWVDDDKNGISIVPTGNYGFEIDIYDEQL